MREREKEREREKSREKREKSDIIIILSPGEKKAATNDERVNEQAALNRVGCRETRSGHENDCRAALDITDITVRTPDLQALSGRVRSASQRLDETDG